MKLEVLTGFGDDWNAYAKKYFPVTGTGEMCGISGIRVTSIISKAAHGALAVGMAVARGAFLVAVRLNVFALASIIYASGKNAQAKTYWSNAWYNLGGNPSKLYSNAAAGRSRKAILMKLAPQKIKDAFRNIGISGFDTVGLGAADPFTGDVPSSVSNSADWTKILAGTAEILAQVLDLVSGTIALTKGDSIVMEAGDGGVSPYPPPPDTENNFSLSGGLGIAALGLGLFFGGKAVMSAIENKKPESK